MLRVFIGAIALVSLAGCFTQLRQTREPVSADCASWAAPSVEGSALTLSPGETGRYEDVTILFTEIELDRGNAYTYRDGYGRHAGWRPGWYGPPPRRVLYDLIVLSVCRPGEVPVDRKLYLSLNPWYARDETTVGSYRITVDRLERARSGDSDAEEKWRLTLKIKRIGENSNS